MRPIIYGIGLSDEEIHTLEVTYPLLFSVVSCSPDELDEGAIENILKTARCIVVNPKTLLPGQLDYIVSEHAATVDNAFTPILLLSESERENQKYELWQGNVYYHKVDLSRRFNRKRKAAFLTLKNGAMPTWSNTEAMKSNMFNDGWYLISLETTGPHPLDDEIAIIHIAYMADYKIQHTETLEVETTLPHKDEEKSNEFRTNTISLKEAVEHISNLPNRYAPFIFWNEDYTGDFLKMAWRLCGKQFEHPYIALNGLASLIFGYTLNCTPSKLHNSEHKRRITRTEVEDEQSDMLYDITLSVFEALMQYFDIRSPFDLSKLLADESEGDE